MKRYNHMIIVVTIVVALLVGCAPVRLTPTPELPTHTPVPPTSTLPPPTVTETPLPTQTAVPTEAPPPTQSPLPLSVRGGLIAFVSTRDGNGEIYVMNSDGSEPQRLTNYQQWDGYPSWSPDGTRIAYYSYLSARDWVIKVMDADGGNPRQLTDNRVCDGAPHWSPDGTRIAYGSAADCNPERREIYIIDADGGNPRNLTQSEADEMGSSWSPDSQQIVFASDRDGNYELYSMDVDGGNVSRLTQNDARDMMPAWSPDGTRIAFVSDREGNDEIYLMDVSGGNVQRLTDEPTDDWFPSWSPDGTQLVFNSWRDGNLEIYVMDADGGNVVRLTDSRGEDFNAVWQPVPATTSETSTWIRLYDGDPRWAALDGLPTEAGGFLLVGATNYSHSNTDREDICLVKIDSAGEILWQKTYGGDRFDRGNAIIPGDDGSFVILGETRSFGEGDRDLYLLKVDQEGNELWSRTFGGPELERANAIQPTADGGFILVGLTHSFGAGGGDLYLVRVDGAGEEVWSKAYGGESEEEGYAIRQVGDGSFLVLGQLLHAAQLYTEQDPDLFLLRVDEAGNEIWSQVWAAEGIQGGVAIVPAGEGYYLITGASSPAENESELGVLLVMVDEQGEQVWDRSFGDAYVVDYGGDIIRTAEGGYLLTGMSVGSGRGAILLVMIDEVGDIIWSRRLAEGSGNKVGLRIIPAENGGYLIVGNTDERGYRFETLLVKTDAQGNVNE